MKELDVFLGAPQDAGMQELTAYLDEACGPDRALRRRVEDLLATEKRVDEFMTSSPLVEEFEMDEDESALLAEGPGTVIGNYRLVEPIGEGGFGTVWRAEQGAPVKRVVALKIIKLGMDTRQVVARFEAEKQALAMMDHAHIAKVHDAGSTETGRPYFVMELVDGIPITQFCDRERLGMRKRLALFMEVCGAVQHAHQKGIIHRDLKPSNVLVTRHNGSPVPKVIDFGVAKATQQALTDATIHTRQEQFIGTPAYMSPEQVKGSGQDLDTRSDIYALGVLLYELLTGTTPFEAKRLATASQEEVRRVICEEDPRKPSTRVSGLDAEERRELAERWKADPASLPRALRGDLDWIVLKAMEKDRARRYETANGLAADIARHLADEPVTAGAPGRGYRIGKYVRRHRAGLGAAAAIAVALLVGMVFSVRFGVLATRAKEKAEAAQAEAQRNEQSIAFRLADPIPLRDNPVMGIAHLARFVRENPENLVAAERLMAALQNREFVSPRLRPIPEGNYAAFSADGSKVVTWWPTKGKIKVWSTSGDGPSLGSAMVLDPVIVHEVQFSPDQLHLLICGHKFPPTGRAEAKGEGVVEVWDWATGTRIHALQQDGAVATTFARFSPDGRWVFVGNENGAAGIWSMETGRLRREFVHPGGLISGSWSPDGRSVATCGWNGTVRLWDAESGEALLPAPISSEGQVRSIRFSPDGRRIVTSSINGSAQVWDPQTGQPVGKELGHDDRVEVAEFSPDGSLVVTASWDRTARVWETESGEPLTGPLEHNSQVVKATFSPDGQWIATGSRTGEVQLWDIGTSRRIGAPFQHEEMIRSLEFSPDGKDLLTSSFDSFARIWPVRPASPGPAMLVLRHRDAPEWDRNGRVVWSAAFSSDGQRLITGASSEVKIWDSRSGELLHLLALPGQRKMVRFSRDGNRALSTSNPFGLRIWDLSNGPSPSVFAPVKNQYVSGAEFSPDVGGSWVASASVTGHEARVWNASDGAAASNPLPQGKVMRVRFSPGGEKLVTCGDDGAVKIWNWRNQTGNRLLLTIDAHKRVESVMFSPDGSTVLTASRDGTARIWNAETGEQVGQPFEHLAMVKYAEFSPDGKWVVTASLDGNAVVWDAATGTPLGEPMKHELAVLHASFSPDGRRVVTASLDHSARVWDAQSGRPLSEPLRHEGALWYATFSPDGRRVVTCGDDTTARVWDVPPAPPGKVPAWVPDWAEALVGFRMERSGFLTRLDWDERERIKARVRAEPEDGYYGRIARWHDQDPSRRTITPFLELTLEQEVSGLIRENTVESLQEVLRVDPGNLEALAGLARIFGRASEEDTAKRRMAVHFARLSLSRALARSESLVTASESTLSAPDVRRRRGFLREKADLLALVGRSAEAEDARKQVVAVPLRNPELDDRMIDLAEHYSASFFAAKEPVADSENFWLGRLAELYEAGDGPGFDIRGKVQLNSGRYPEDSSGSIAGKDLNEQAGLNRPMEIEGIAIGRKAAKLHFLQSCHWGREEPGVEVASYRVHYEDGSSKPIPVIYGKDIADFSFHARPKEVKEGLEHIAWEQDFQAGSRRNTLALTRQTWENPHPEKKITHLDFESAGKKAAPFLVGITVE